MEPFAGGCLCGAVRYQAHSLLYPATLCHCTSCRRAAGAHAVGWFTVAAENFSYLSSLPALYRSSPGVRREFCARCGTPITYRCDPRPREVDITIGSLDDPGRVIPADHIWMADAPGWDRPADRLPQYPGHRGA